MKKGRKMAPMSKWVKVLAVVIAAVAVVLLAYAVLTPEDTTDSHMGMNGHMIYSSANVGIIAVALVLLVAAVMVVALWNEYEPLPPSMTPPPHAHEKLPAGPPAAVGPPEACVPSDEEAASRNYLVLRLLSGDERTMFKSIMDSGGEALQKDLMSRNNMSNAKVSRVLDRLLQKGVITKERFGATNKIVIKPQP